MTATNILKLVNILYARIGYPCSRAPKIDWSKFIARGHYTALDEAIAAHPPLAEPLGCDDIGTYLPRFIARIRH
jgi:hypothetical protein